MVDDDPTIRAVLADLLEDEGFAVRTAKDGLEALERCEEGTPDLLVLDLNMPKFDGVQVIEELTVRGLRTFPIVLLTADSHQRRLVGRAEHVTGKPFDLEALLKVIARLLSAARARPNGEGANEGETT